ncbi:MAG TPA: autotransporter domain-containing protein, partial [Rhabdochlamydiaceae bacterium]|nr:autotransporter domain-containing protein [Rhabdochlamydiaceae bacterium]
QIVLGSKNLTLFNANPYNGVISGVGGSITAANASVMFGGANTYTGGTNAIGGVFLELLNAANNIGAPTGTLTVDSSFVLLDAGFTLPNPINLITSGQFIQNGSTFTTTLSGIISGGGTLILSAAPGPFILTNPNNSYSGGTNIDGGATVIISSAGNLGSPSATISFTTAPGTLEATNTLSLSAPISLTTDGTFDTPSGVTMTLSGIISGGGMLTKQDSGTLVLSGANTYSGQTNFNGGILSISASNNLGTSPQLNFNAGTLQATNTFSLATPVNLAGAGTFDVTSANNFTLTGSITGGGSLTKTDTGTLTPTNVGNTYSGGTNFNAGTISISSSGNLGAGGILTFNGGILQATSSVILTQNITLNTTGTFDTTPGGTNLLLSGAITGGGGLVKTGAGMLTLTNGSNAYSGGTIINAGTLALTGAGTLPPTGPVTINGGTFDISGIAGTSTTIGDLSGAAGTSVVLGTKTLIEGTANSTTYAGVISGIGGGFTKQGTGTLTLTGTNTYTGATTVANGKLLVNGVIQGITTVDQPGILGGIGTVGQVINNWHVEPGTSIGTLTVAGNYVSNSGSTLLMEINSAGASDLLNVTGSVTINNGSTLEVSPENGTYTMGTIYTIVDGSSVTGTFSNVIVDPFGPRNTRLQVMVIYDPTDIRLQLTGISMTSFSEVAAGSGATPNERAVAAAIDAFGLQPTGDQGVIVAALDSLLSNPAAFNAALNQLQPSPFTALALTQESDGVKVRSAFTHRLQELYTITCSEKYSEWERYNLWVEPFGDYIHQHSQGGEPGFHTKGGGVVIGSDFRLVNNLYLGLGAGYSHSSIDWRMTPKDEGEIDSYYGGIYTTWRPRDYYFYIDASFVGAYNGYEATRHIEFATINRRARSTHQGYELAGQVGVGGLFQVGRLLIQPFGREEYIYVHEGDYTERGAQSIDLHVHSKNSDLWRTEVGLNLSGCFNWYPVKLIPTGYASWVHEHRNKGKHITSNFRDQTFNFTVTGFNPRHRDLVSGGIGFTTLCADDHCAIGLLYHFEVNEHYWDNELSLRVGYGF